MDGFNSYMQALRAHPPQRSYIHPAPVPVAPTNVLGAYGLQQQGQHLGLGIGGLALADGDGRLRLVGGTVHPAEQRGQVHRLVGEQRRQQDVVLPDRVRREHPGDLLGLPGGRGAIGQDRKPRPGRRQGSMLGDHLADHSGQVGVRRGSRVNRLLLGCRVR